MLRCGLGPGEMQAGAGPAQHPRASQAGAVAGSQTWDVRCTGEMAVLSRTGPSSPSWPGEALSVTEGPFHTLSQELSADSS